MALLNQFKEQCRVRVAKRNAPLTLHSAFQGKPSIASLQEPRRVPLTSHFILSGDKPDRELNDADVEFYEEKSPDIARGVERRVRALTFAYRFGAFHCIPRTTRISWCTGLGYRLEISQTSKFWEK